MFSDTVYSLVGGVNHTYTSTRTFTESGGVGVNLTSSEMCYKSADRCDYYPSINYRIEANSELVHTGKRFWTSYDSENFTLKYWGVDDNGYDVYVEQSLCVEGTSFTENCDVG